MRHRSFHDSSGRRWTVSEITNGLPAFAARSQARDVSGPRGSIGTRRFAAALVAAPWLCFDVQRLLGESHVVPVGHIVHVA
jgi:hypothetical protein